MNRKQILHKLRDQTLDSYTRERLQQLLHYYTTEGIDGPAASTREPESGKLKQARSVQRKKFKQQR